MHKSNTKNSSIPVLDTMYLFFLQCGFFYALKSLCLMKMTLGTGYIENNWSWEKLFLSSVGSSILLQIIVCWKLLWAQITSKNFLTNEGFSVEGSGVEKCFACDQCAKLFSPRNYLSHFYQQFQTFSLWSVSIVIFSKHWRAHTHHGHKPIFKCFHCD